MLFNLIMLIETVINKFRLISMFLKRFTSYFSSINTLFTNKNYRLLEIHDKQKVKHIIRYLYRIKYHHTSSLSKASKIKTDEKESIIY